jgi:hypothetical protein
VVRPHRAHVGAGARTLVRERVDGATRGAIGPGEASRSSRVSGARRALRSKPRRGWQTVRDTRPRPRGKREGQAYEVRASSAEGPRKSPVPPTTARPSARGTPPSLRLPPRAAPPLSGGPS